MAKIFCQKDFCEVNFAATLMLVVSFDRYCLISKFRSQSFLVDCDSIIFGTTPATIGLN